jgi:predicted permease
MLNGLKWAGAILRRLVPPPEADILVGDLEEAHRTRVTRRGALIGAVVTSLETVDIAFMLLRRRFNVRTPISWMDLKLSLRMLVRYPVLSAVSTVSLALGVAIGATAFAATAMMVWPTLPLPDGDRIVSIRMHDDGANRYESRLTADFLRWRNDTDTLTDIGAGSQDEQGLTMGDGTTESVYTAAVTASTFSLGRVTPVIGRVLSDEDASPAAPAVIVIGQRLWRERFSSDPAILTRPLMLGARHVSVVGVLPEAFRFPRIAEVWEPLRLDESAAPRTGMGLLLWARLKPGVTLASAASDLAVLAKRNAADWPATHARLTPDVRLYPRAFLSSDAEDPLGIGVLNLVVLLLIAVVCGNVALLMFARAATRESEIVVRSALGAGRARLVAQFLAESSVLSAFGFVAGIVLARLALRYGIELLIATNNGRPFSFWIQPVLPPVSIAYGVGLAVFSALMTGVLPAMKVTRGLSSRLRERAAGAGGLRFGGVWTVLIVAQVALTMAVPITMYNVRGGQAEMAAKDIGVPKTEYLISQLSAAPRMPAETFVRDVSAIRDALTSIPGVSQATLADQMPLVAHDTYALELDEGGAAAPFEGDDHRGAVAAVERNFFEYFAMPPVAGRLFAASDYVGHPRVAIVNQLFVDRVFGGRNPIGRRVRFKVPRQGRVYLPPNIQADTNQPWLEIVGVVRDVSMGYPGSNRKHGLYIPLDLKSVSSIWLTLRVPGAGPGGLSAQMSALRVLAVKTDPDLRLTRVESLEEELARSVNEIGVMAKVLSVVSAWVMLLALSGIYAVMSFAVSRRTREIGIRVALGSNRPRVVLAILRRPIIQVSAGVIIGTVVGIAFGKFVGANSLSPLVMSGYILLLAGICVLACVMPARRALKVDPIAALRTD